MERLTARNDGKPYYPACFELPCNGLLCERDECDLGDKIIDRLAAYEDTGLTPKEIVKRNEAYIEIMTRTYGPFRQKISQWLQADQAGRLVVLPCKVGDTVYIVESVMKGKRHIGEKIVSAQIDHVTIGESGKPVLDVCTETGNWYGPLEAGEFWTTREEAEAALREATEHG